MSFEFKKAFEKATEKRGLTFNQQWAMSDDTIFSSEHPVHMALYNVPPGKKFSIRQLQVKNLKFFCIFAFFLA